jgi:hypothetical protein
VAVEIKEGRELFAVFSGKKAFRTSLDVGPLAFSRERELNVHVVAEGVRRLVVLRSC